jgi:ABC-2 type transport system ATP-binding protein
VKTELKDKTILWTSHNLYEIDEICHRIAMINKGRILFIGKPDTLKREGIEQETITMMVEPGESSFFSTLEGSEIINEYTVEIISSDIKKTLRDILDTAETHDITIKDLKTAEPTLEEAYMKRIEQDA